MDSGLKQRLVGAAVLVALAVIFLPMLVQGPAPDSGVADVPLSMPNAPQARFETRDLPLVTPGAAPDGGALGMQARPIEADAQDDGAELATVDTATAPPAATSNALPDGAASRAVPLPATTLTTPAAEPLPPTAAAKPVQVAAAKPAPMLPAATAGGDYAVHFGSYATAGNADTILRQLRGSQLMGYSERTTLNGKPAYRVRIGPYASRAEAEAARLRAAHVRDDVQARVVALDADRREAATAATPPAATPAVAAPIAKVEPVPARTTASTPPATATPTAAAGVGYAVQLGAFSKAADATALRDRVRAAGFAAFTETVDTDRGALTRVRVGPVVDRADADRLKAQVQARVGVDGLVRAHP